MFGYTGVRDQGLNLVIYIYMCMPISFLIASKRKRKEPSSVQVSPLNECREYANCHYLSTIIQQPQILSMKDIPRSTLRSSRTPVLITAISSFTLFLRNPFLPRLLIGSKLSLLERAGALEGVVGFPSRGADVGDAVGVFKDFADFFESLCVCVMLEWGASKHGFIRRKGGSDSEGPMDGHKCPKQRAEEARE